MTTETKHPLDKMYVPGEDPEFPPEFISTGEQMKAKLAICSGCDDNIDANCKHCNCNVFVIAYINIKSCPIGKF